MLRWLVWIMGGLWLALAGAAGMAAPFALGGGEQAQAQEAHIRAELLAEQSKVAPGGATTIAISMTPAPTWHGYWKNGGDAGFGMQVQWDLPDGVTIGALDYPVPETLIIAGLMNHVYERPYALLAPLRLDAGVAAGTRLPVRGRAQWLACTDKICVPESGLLSLELVAGQGSNDRQTARFDAWRAALPQPLDRTGRMEIAGGMARFAIPVPKALALERPHLFVETADLVRYAAAQKFSRSGDWLIVETDAAKAAMAGPATLLLRTDDHRGLIVKVEPGVVPRGGDAAGEGGGWLFVTALAGAIIGGLLLNLMPCVFPILSFKALSLARMGGDAREVRREALAYLAGAVLVALLLGALLIGLRASGQTIGWAFQLQHPASVLILLALASAITANLLGWFQMPALNSGHGLASQGGARGGFWTGALAAFVATPCSGPFMGAALGATLTLPVWAALPVFGGLGLGLALPFVGLAFVPALRSRLPKPGLWMARFARWMALPMALTVAALMWLLFRQMGYVGVAVGGLAVMMVAATAWAAGRSQAVGRRSAPLWLGSIAVLAVAAVIVAQNPAPATTAALSWQGEAFSEARLATLRGAGRPVFVYFTADWCLTCKANEAGAIDRDETAAAFAKAGVAVLVADWTNGDPAITRTLASHGRNSVPLYLWYAPGTEAPEILPQILTPSMLVTRAGASK